MEYFFACPYCWQRISMVLDTSVSSQTMIEDCEVSSTIDTSVSSQTMIEDCEVCCHPIQVRYSVEDEAITDFDAAVLE